MITDTTFFTNEPGYALIDRFKKTLEHVRYFDVLVGYFRTSGLIANREFNVELKDRVDVEFALKQFENLWKDSVNISQEYVETIRNKTWLNDTIIPYHLYLKMLYEYMKEDINLDEEIDLDLPEGFMELEYQKQAVVSAKKILDAYN